MAETAQFNHFSHRHPLIISTTNKKEEEEICSGCEFPISAAAGPGGGCTAYMCTKPGCGFVLHDSCFDLPRVIRHVAHPKHPLTLLSAPPYGGDREFTCDACGGSGHAFTYHCGKCKFDLHIECASVPETEVRDDHPHPLVLCYSKGKDEEEEFDCYVCKSIAHKRVCWFYYCFTCKCGTHIDCATI